MAVTSRVPSALLAEEAEYPKDEPSLRRQLAACYRILSKLQMTDLVYNHISARVPGDDHHFLINPFGLLYNEITASNLIKVDLNGNAVGGGGRGVNPAGFFIHSAIHMSRFDARAVLHTHTLAGVAVSALHCGLLPITQFALQFYDRIAYHDFTAIDVNPEERLRLVQSVGDKDVVILRNHGLLSLGRTIPEAFARMYYLEQSCKAQLMIMSTGSTWITPSEEDCRKTCQQLAEGGGPVGAREFDALVRELNRTDSTYTA